MNMNRHASSEILDCMLAFYKASLECFFDQDLTAMSGSYENSSGKYCRIRCGDAPRPGMLECFFSPSTVQWKCVPNSIQKIAAESPDTI